MKRTVTDAAHFVQSPRVPSPLVLSFRWLLRRDLPSVLRIEFEACADPWGPDDFLRLLRERNVVGSVALLESNLVGPAGYCIYSWDSRAWTLLRLAVHPDYQRRGIGRALLGRLAEKLEEPFCKTRNKIEHLIPDWNLNGQLFLQKCGFRGTSVLRGLADDADRYLMRRSLSRPTPPR